MADLQIFNLGGSIIKVIPTSKAGRAWVIAHISPEEYQPGWPNWVIVEPRYIESVVDGATADGLAVG